MKITTLRGSVSTSLEVLKRTPENWIEFSAGQNSDANLSRFKREYYLVAFAKQLGSLLHLFLRIIRVSPSSKGEVDILFFASSFNQYRVLHPVFLECKRKNTCKLFVTYNLIGVSKNIDAHIYGIGPLKSIQIIILAIVRAKVMFNIFAKYPDLFFYRLRSFFAVHIWLIVHFHNLKICRPKIVVIANDHTADCRAMIEMCKHLKIDTAYVQHAEVSQRFHSLDFNYSFLYGEKSLRTYQQVDERRSPTSLKINKRMYMLAGKVGEGVPDNISFNKNDSALSIGLAVKGTDTPAKIIEYIRTLGQYGQVIVRPHPNLSIHDFYDSLRCISPEPFLVSNPEQEPPEKFLNKINVLLSGNSTMLIEASLAGVHPFYVNEMTNGVYDYYGYVKFGVVTFLATVNDFSETNEDLIRPYSPDSKLIRHFIASYGTLTFGKEHIRIAEALNRAKHGDVSCFEVFDTQTILTNDK